MSSFSYSQSFLKHFKVDVATSALLMLAFFACPAFVDIVHGDQTAVFAPGIAELFRHVLVYPFACFDGIYSSDALIGVGLLISDLSWCAYIIIGLQDKHIRKPFLPLALLLSLGTLITAWVGALRSSGVGVKPGAFFLTAAFAVAAASCWRAVIVAWGLRKGEEA